MQLVNFPEARGPLDFSYDEEWLSILHSTHNLLSLNRQAKPLPGVRSRLCRPLLNRRLIPTFVCM